METTSSPAPRAGRESEPASASAEVVIPDRLYFRIGDVAELLGVKPYVLRYWETEFPMVSPQKSETGQRVYRRGDVETLALIRRLLYRERYSIEGARKRLRELRREGRLKEAKAAVTGAGASGVAAEPSTSPEATLPPAVAPRASVARTLEPLLARPLDWFFPLLAP